MAKSILKREKRNKMRVALHDFWKTNFSEVDEAVFEINLELLGVPKLEELTDHFCELRAG